MLKNLWRRLALAGAFCAALVGSAGATLVDYEDVSPTLFSADSITSRGFVFTSDGFGFSGVDGPAAFSAFGNAPGNAVDQFLFMLNTDGMRMKSETGKSFALTNFDASFIAPVGGLGAGLDAGELYLFGYTGSGVVLDIFSFGLSDANGNFNFNTYTTSNVSVLIVEAYFLACIYDSTGSCSFVGDTILPQFALDNLNAVPEPASLVLVLSAVGLIGLRRRPLRQSRHSA